MRVLQAMAGARHGGAEGFFMRLVPALARAGVAQQVLVRPHPEVVARLGEAGLATITAPFGGWFDRRTRPIFKRAIDDFAPDIVLTWMNRATLACPRARAGGFVQVARLGGYYDLKYYRACDHLIGNTPDIVNYLRRSGWPAERGHYLPNFVAQERLPKIDRASLATPEDAPLILAMGRLHHNKGFDVLLEALTQLPDHWLWLAGVGPLAASLEAQARRRGIEGRVRFLGWRDDGPRLLAAADMLVCPSRHEPLGNVVIEAWAQGVPVVASAAEGPGALIRHGETGLLVAIGDAGALAQAVRAVPRVGAALREAGIKAFQADYTEPAVVARYQEFFERARR